MLMYWHGLSSVRIEASLNQRDAVLVTDPFEADGSVKFPKAVLPDIVVMSHQDRKRFAYDQFETKPFLVSDPGEFEVKGIYVQGIQDKAKDSGAELRPVIYRMMIEGMNVAFLGKLDRKPTDAEVEALENVDVLLLPVGGGGGMDAKLAGETVSLIEPRMVVPLHYDVPGLASPLGTVDAFCSTLGGCTRQDAPKLKVSRKDLPADTIVVSVLERS